MLVLAMLLLSALMSLAGLAHWVGSLDTFHATFINRVDHKPVPACSIMLCRFDDFYGHVMYDIPCGIDHDYKVATISYSGRSVYCRVWAC
jgi:hypothetical protein